MSTRQSCVARIGFYELPTMFMAAGAAMRNHERPGPNTAWPSYKKGRRLEARTAGIRQWVEFSLLSQPDRIKRLSACPKAFLYEIDPFSMVSFSTAFRLLRRRCGAHV